MKPATALAALALALAGCASIELPSAPAIEAADTACHAHYAALDEAVDRAGVRDAEAERIPGFPSLRVDRASAALGARARSSDAAFAAWLRELTGLDFAARAVEFSNLPVRDNAALQRVVDCSFQLATSTLRNPAARQALLDRAQVPDRYSNAARAAGLYALTRLPFFSGVQGWERGHMQAMRESAANPRPARRLAPDAAFTPSPHEAPLASTIARNALGLPQIGDALAERLFAAYAPLLDIEAQGAFDEIGAPAWQHDGRIGVDTHRPVVYQRLAQTLVRGQPLLQLVYTLWFPERPKSSRFDLLAGALDGLILRITLAPDGTPLMLDTIHACGCYHLFFPAPGVTLRAGAPSNEEWAFVPAELPAWRPGSRFVVRIASATHDVLGVTVTAQAMPEPSAELATYARRPESALRRLPTPTGGTRSLYGPDGLVAGSERAERFLFWPMGIASAGAMRQWGHHATAFVGRRHFDDADLLERRFDVPALR